MPLILGTNSIKDTGYDVANSLRFNHENSDYLSRTTTSPNSDKKYTFSCWIKRSGLGKQYIIADYGSSSNYSEFGFNSNDQLFAFQQDGGSTAFEVVTNRVFRDLSAWYHILYVFDSAQSTDTNRLKFFINGVQETSMSGTNYPNLNLDTRLNGNGRTYCIGQSGNNSNYFSGYLTEIVGLDNQALDPTSFGTFDNDSPNIWKPIDVSGLTFGNNGFHLDFENASSLGADVSGNSNNFTVNNLTSVDQSTDTCTNNFCTPNPLHPPRNGSVTFSEGNLKTVFTSYEQSPNGTIGAGAGKWYYEMKMSGTHARFGWCESHCPQGDTDSNDTFPAYAIYSNGSNGLSVYKNVTARGVTANTGYTSFSAGDTVGIAFDIDNGKFYAHLNGTYYNSGNPANGTGALITGITAQAGGLFLPYLNCGTSSSRTFEWNFGSPSHAISSGNADANGFGNFEYAVPSGYFTLCTKNLAEFG
tara:strand:- start:384 stop:1799 length:1416 start_codon:yes stop_codon:yes gene_type:complete